MTTLYHEIELVSSAERVWSLLTTRAGLNKWWPGEVSIHGGDSWRFQNDNESMALVFRVVEEEPDQVLEWLCTQGDDDWHNTLVHFRVKKREAGLNLVIEHRNLRLSAPDSALLNTKWGVCANRLRECLHEEILTLDEDDLNAWT